MSGSFKPPFSKEFISAFRLTLSLAFQRNEYRLFIFLMKSFLVEIRDARYKTFGIANDLITCIHPNKVRPLQLQPFKDSLGDFSIVSKFIFVKQRVIMGEVDTEDFNHLT